MFPQNEGRQIQCMDKLNINELFQRRELAYTFKEFSDIDLPYVYYYNSEDELVEQVINFFLLGSELIYPAKSFFVALVYADLIGIWYDLFRRPDSNQWFLNWRDYNGLKLCASEAASSFLCDKRLLPDDKFFEPMTPKNNHIYENIVRGLMFRKSCNLANISQMFPRTTSATRYYFYSEFLMSAKEIEEMEKFITWSNCTKTTNI